MQRTQSNRISPNIANRMNIFENTGICFTPPDNLCRSGTESRENSPHRYHLQSPSHLRNLNTTDRIDHSAQQYGELANMMSMSSSPPPGVQTDAEGLILPKKLINPCLESTDRKELHRELKFNTKIGKSVLNQKTELQRAYEKQKEKQHLHQQHIQDTSPTSDLKSELSRVIMERAQKHDHARQQDADLDDDRQYVNPEYLNARAKLRHGQHSDLK